MKNLTYIGIVLLFLAVLFQNKSCENEQPTPSIIDTLVIYNTIRDTVIIEKPVYIGHKIDTVWLEKPENAPDSTYEGLLNQYTQLGNSHFRTNVFRTTFPISNYGTVLVTDSIYGNWLMSSTLTSNLAIPTTTITIEKPLPKKNEFYIGGTLTLSKSYPTSGIYGGILMKNKKDRIYGVSVGYNGELQYGLSIYHKIKLK